MKGDDSQRRCAEEQLNSLETHVELHEEPATCLPDHPPRTLLFEHPFLKLRHTFPPDAAVQCKQLATERSVDALLAQAVQYWQSRGTGWKARGRDGRGRVNDEK